MIMLLEVTAALAPVVVPRMVLGRKQLRQRLDVLLYRCESPT
ncbi:hypothetical protein [Humibacillus xanthopallidus]|uniref:Uncharacterized protein n=1 Tax=Humibacillus xanthopallidus TaxID=412689 RepID=A0A543HJ82_9MICO|nr:hypothetical protein [Humibacillus xanthopallidus]TQM58402.1 hypothetical protein FBY41_3769 [Humibacillus xanthopallidus]